MMYFPNRLLLVFVSLLVCVSPLTAAQQRPLTLVVMDPLSKPLSCDCVKGYAQRDYNALADHLAKTLKRKVNVVWFESLAEALRETDGQADLVIGKHSIVLADEKTTGHELTPVAQLTGKDGGVTQHGLIVVRRDDAAKDLKSLVGYEILFGPEDAEEKSAAAEKVLRQAGVKLPNKPKRFGACSEAANVLLEMPKESLAAAVISSYAEPLLEGCGSIQKGDLRVVGKTEPVPFVTMFLRDSLASRERVAIQLALFTAGTDPDFLKRMETLAGFTPWHAGQGLNPGPVPKPESTDTSASRDTSSHRQNSRDWNDFRGPNRDGRVAWLPSQLPDMEKDLVWAFRLPSDGIGGLAVGSDVVIASGRSLDDQRDVFVGIDLRSGNHLWTHEYLAVADLDYGNSPRATPVLSGDVAITLGATGVLSAINRSTGTPLWTVNLSHRFQTPVPTWGFCATPIVVDQSIFLQVGKQSSLAAIDLATGKTNWRVRGESTAYSSMTHCRKGDLNILIGVDEEGYFARNVADGGLLWNATPEISGDFGVPSPVIVDRHVVFASENNGIQAFPFLPDGGISRSCIVNDLLIPESHTPTFAGGQVLVAHEGLHGLDVANGLTENWSVAEDWITGYASVIASDEKALVTTESGELLLIGFDNRSARVLDRTSLGDRAVSVLSHPAVVGDHLILRVGKEIRCYAL